jgi:hypothetical protein
MKRELVPYYISRGILAALLGWFMSLQLGLWLGVGMGVLTFAGFLWYAHSGFYLVDTSHPLFPLRRDTRGSVVRDKAVLAAVAAGMFIFLLIFLIDVLFDAGVPNGPIPLAAGIITYFVTTQWLFLRA